MVRMSSPLAILTIMTIGLTDGIAGTQATIGGAWRRDVAAVAERIVEAQLVVGMQVAVTVGDWVVYEQGFGSADLDTGRPVTDDTRFYIASSTKSLTALAAALAMHRGDVDLNAPMVRYLPGAQFADGVPRESITMRHLLEMSHGLDGGGPVVLRTAYTGEFTRNELLDLLRYHEAEGHFGEFRYNNLGYNLLGMVLESVYDASWKDVVHREVVQPIGMHHTTAYPSRLARDVIALPHGTTPDGFARIPLGKTDANAHAAGGHFTTAGDLARYLAVHISGGRVDGVEVLPATPVRETHRLRIAQDRNFGPFHRHGWGYGWDIGTYDGDTLLHRFGGFAGYRSHMSFMPQHGIGVTVLVNATGTASSASDLLATYIYDRLLGKPAVETRTSERVTALETNGAQSRAGLADHLEERRARLAPLAHPLEDFAGVYTSPVLGTAEWRVIGGGLEMRLGVVRSRAEVFDAARNQLRVEVGGGVVAAFTFPAGGGPATSMTMAGTEFTRQRR